jgi:2-keto-4-pentenoate hydratase
MKESELKKIAKTLRKAESSRIPIAPIRHRIGTEDIDLAYRIQDINREFRIRKGHRVIGKKIGFTSRVVQEQLGVDHPGFGVLFSDREVENGRAVSVSNMMMPMIEAEIAFVLKKHLDRPDISIVDVINAIDYAVPAIEIIASRFHWDIKITDTIADNASTSHFVIGHTPKKLYDFDVVNCGVTTFKNEELVSEGVGSDCMGSPINAMLWLARKMYQLGNPLRAKELIYTGAIGPVTPVEAGDHCLVSIQGLGSVSVFFE